MSNQEWYYGQDGVQRGPVTLAELRALVRTGQISPDDLVWFEGMPDWLPARDAAALWEEQTAGTVPLSRADPRVSPLAIASLALGLMAVACCPLTGIGAVVCGHMALSQIRREPHLYKGWGLALAGLILGYLYLAALLVLAVARLHHMP